MVECREDVDGKKRLVAYVVPDPGYDPTGAKHAETDTSHALVSQWQVIFDNLYNEVDPDQRPQFYIKGWESSYTGQPISDTEVEEWMHQTVTRILSQNPSRVWEIGCGGSGLMLFRIAPHCREYCGTDLSANALAVLRAQLDALEISIPGVRLEQRSADDFRNVEPNSLDAVVIVSVVQYFPNIEYLLTVIENALRAIQPGGFLFLGDVRSAPLLAAFHASVQLYRASSTQSTKELQWQIQRQLALENQLAVDPEFFRVLPRYLPKIGDVKIHLLRGRNRNELTRFRYDVILHVGPQKSAMPPRCPHDWQQEGWTLDSLRRHLIDSRPESLWMVRVPNDRIWADLTALQLLESQGAPETVGGLREALRAMVGSAVDPEELWALGDELSYAVEITWSASGAEGCFDVLMRRLRCEPEVQPPIEVESGGSSDPPQESEELWGRERWSKYANNPSRRIDDRELVPILRRHLQERLPDYMVPAAFLMMAALPLLPSGKVDRRALPAPGTERPELAETFVAPTTPQEKLLAPIWSEVLGLDRIGIHDNFFELGGDSILGIQIVARARRSGLDLAPRDLFQHQTVARLAAALSPASSATAPAAVSSEPTLDSPSSASRSSPSASDREPRPVGGESAPGSGPTGPPRRSRLQRLAYGITSALRVLVSERRTNRGSPLDLDSEPGGAGKASGTRKSSVAKLDLTEQQLKQIVEQIEDQQSQGPSE